MSQRVCEVVLNFCNDRCPDFFHNYEDRENIWCARLSRKIFDFQSGDDPFCDLREREIPDDCPLPVWRG